MRVGAHTNIKMGLLVYMCNNIHQGGSYSKCICPNLLRECNFPISVFLIHRTMKRIPTVHIKVKFCNFGFFTSG